MKIDIDSLSLEDVEMVENLTGIGIDQILEAGKPKGRALRAFIYVIKRKEDPNYTFDMTGKISAGEAHAMFETDPDPKD